MSYKITGKMLRPYQLDIIKPIIKGEKKHLFLVLPRRSGKSTLVYWLVNYLINKHFVTTGKPCNGILLAPETAQARNIFVENILDNGKKLINIANAKFIESRLMLEYEMGGVLKISGSDRVDNVVGLGAYVVVLDEFAIARNPDAYQRLLPMVKETGGTIIICTTPRGKNHVWKLMQKLKNHKDWHIVHKNVIELGLMTWEQYDALEMDEAFKRQEYLCDFDSSNMNAVFSPPNIKKILWDKSLPVYASIDLGIRDATEIGYFHIINNRIEFFDHQRFTNTSLEIIVRQMPYKIKKLAVPHDGKVTELLFGISRWDYLLRFFDCVYIPKHGVLDSIDITRRMWHLIWFDEDKCGQLIESVKSYVKDDDERPIHDDASHGCDMIRYACLYLTEFHDDTIYTPYEYINPEMSHMHGLYGEKIIPMPKSML